MLRSAEMNDFIKEIQEGRRLPKDTFFAEGNSICCIGKIEPAFDIDDEQLCHKTVSAFLCDVTGCNQTFTLVYEYEQHYNSVHRYTCKECRKTLPSPHLLDIHIMETHDTYFAVLSERKPMYQCFVEECTLKFSTPQERRSHCIETHKFPPDFRFDGSRKTRGVKGKSKTNLHKKSQKETNEDVSSNMMKIEDGVVKNVPSHSTSKTPQVNIPKGFTFGHNQERTFMKSKETKNKHWYQRKEIQQPNEVTTQDLPNMGELMDSLPADNSWYAFIFA